MSELTLTSQRHSTPALLAQARAEVAVAADLQAVATVIDRLAVLRVAAKKARLSLAEQNEWATVKLEAERKAGKLLIGLRASGRLRGGRPNADGMSALSEAGISQSQSSRWQRLASVPEDEFQAWLAQTTQNGLEVTEVGLATLAARIRPRPLTATARHTAVSADLPLDSVLVGDCLDILRALPDDAFDALITDPPAAISFLSHDWDSDRGGRDAWVAWLRSVMEEVLRVLKPGAHGLVWSLPKTSHWTALALEDAGFVIVDTIEHVFSSGLPKTRTVHEEVRRIDPARSDEWVGYGRSLKPAHETWWLVRKPTTLTTAENVLRYGTGALNIAGTRIPSPKGDGNWEGSPAGGTSAFRNSPGGWQHRGTTPEADDGQVLRFPSNVVLTDPVFDDEDSVEVVGGGKAGHGAYPPKRGDGWYSRFGIGVGRPTPGGGRAMGDGGGKSKYFVLPKASRADRSQGVPGVEPVENFHPTPKSLSLLRHFARMLLPPGGTTGAPQGDATEGPRAQAAAGLGGVVLDPFGGSGTTGVAAVLEGHHYVLIEADSGYADLAMRRLGIGVDAQAAGSTQPTVAD